MRPDHGGSQLSHALAALISRQQREAEQAITRLRSTSPSWERKAHARQLAQVADTRQDLGPGIARLLELLT